MSGERSHTDVAGGVLLDEVLSLCFDTSASANPSVCRRNSWMGVHHEEREKALLLLWIDVSGYSRTAAQVKALSSG